MTEPQNPWADHDIIPTGKVKMTMAGWTVEVDVDKAPCPMCWGEGNIEDDLGYDEEGNFLGEIEILCPRCKGLGTWKLEQENDGQKNS